jgi:hypothetical protein
MVYVGEWSGGFGGGITGGRLGCWLLVLLMVSGYECMRSASSLIEQEKPSGVFFVLIFWSAFEVKSSIIFFYCCLDS